VVRRRSAKPLRAGSIPARASKKLALLKEQFGLLVKALFMKTQEIVKSYIDFFTDKGHKQAPNVSLVPKEDSTLLFVNSGMFPLVPYLLGEPHPLGTRLVNVQRAVRFEDLDEIGDPRHTLAFHMLGNWSFGDYFKEEQLNWFYEFLVAKLGLDAGKLYSTVFDGDSDAPRDEESIKILKDVFSKYDIDAEVGTRIFPYDKKSNWWQRGDAIGELGGPDSEVFYYFPKGDPKTDPENDEDSFLEIGNSVFLQYKKTHKGWEELPQKNVDFGGGLERIALVVQGKKDIFETDNFWPIVEKIQELSDTDYYGGAQITESMRIIADHMRACVFLAMDGVSPSNKDQGYALRRLLRRMVRYARALNIDCDVSVSLVGKVCEMFSWLYPDLPSKQREMEAVFSVEEEKFRKTLVKGQKEMEKALGRIDTTDIEQVVKVAFDLYQSVGYPHEIFFEDLKDRSVLVNKEEFDDFLDKHITIHQQKSRLGAEQKFKGGLADHGEQVVRYHTATHLLHQGLRNVLGAHVSQIGSNITKERLRFDFTHGQKLTEEELQEVEAFINSAVESKLPVGFDMVPIEEAKNSGALYLKNESYPDVVKVYYVGDNPTKAISKEFCGGPHVKNTSELASLEIYKQDKIGDGKIRVYGRFL
jgi:alanyl-tRNA synthetase